jgi:hypothetical protein
MVVIVLEYISFSIPSESISRRAATQSSRKSIISFPMRKFDSYVNQTDTMVKTFTNTAGAADGND